jgi:hypothetical protein
LPSLKPQTNSFVAGVVCTLTLVYAWSVVQPVIKSWVQTVSQSGSGFGVAVLVMVVGFAGWIYGKTETGTGPNGTPPRPAPGSSGQGGASANGNANGYAHGNGGPPPQWGGTHSSGHRPGFNSPPPNGSANYGGTKHEYQPPPFDDTPPSSPPEDKSRPKPQGSSAWERAREETRKREEERRKAEEQKKKQEEDRKRRDDAERIAKAAAEKDKWEQMRAREREMREREAREKLARDRMDKEKAEKEGKGAKEKAERDARLAAAKERAEKLRSERSASEKAASERAQSEKARPVYGVGERLDPYSLSTPGPKSTIGVSGTPKQPSPLRYQKPSAQSYTGTATDNSFRPYDAAPPRPKHHGSASSFVSGYSSDYVPSESTAPTSVPSNGEPYFTDDPDKVMIRGAYKFNDSFPKPSAVVRPGESRISDGLIMKITTEGVFLDDDRKREALRTWDIKAWTMKSVEVSFAMSSSASPESCRSHADLCPKDRVKNRFPYHPHFHQRCRRHQVCLRRPRGARVEGQCWSGASQRRLAFPQPETVNHEQRRRDQAHRPAWDHLSLPARRLPNQVMFPNLHVAAAYQVKR